MFATDRDLSSTEAMYIARAMTKVSAIDGIDNREKELINSFIQDIGTDKDFEQLLSEEFDMSTVGEELEPDIKRLLLESCWMVAFIDGQVSDAEKELIATYAKGLGVENPDASKEKALDNLMQSLSHIKNTDVLAGLIGKLNA